MVTFFIGNKHYSGFNRLGLQIYCNGIGRFYTTQKKWYKSAGYCSHIHTDQEMK